VKSIELRTYSYPLQNPACYCEMLKLKKSFIAIPISTLHLDLILYMILLLGTIHA